MLGRMFDSWAGGRRAKELRSFVDNLSGDFQCEPVQGASSAIPNPIVIEISVDTASWLIPRTIVI